jgi:hypothetical protein
LLSCVNLFVKMPLLFNFKEISSNAYFITVNLQQRWEPSFFHHFTCHFVFLPHAHCAVYSCNLLPCWNFRTIWGGGGARNQVGIGLKRHRNSHLVTQGRIWIFYNNVSNRCIIPNFVILNGQFSYAHFY